MKYEFSVPALPISVNKMYKPRVSKFGMPYVQKSKSAHMFVSEIWVGAKRPKEPIKGRLKAHFSFFCSNLRQYNMSDTDNFIKNCQDALVECKILEDDRYIIRVTAERFYADKDETRGVIEYMDSDIIKVKN